MTMKKKILTMIVPALLLSAAGAVEVRAQDTLWTLHQCVERAISYNLSMKRQELMLESASQDMKQSKLDLLPNLNGNIEHRLGSGRVFDEYNDPPQWITGNSSQGDLGVQSNLTLFSGLQGYHNMKMQKANYQGSMEDLAALEDDLTIEVMTAYLALLRNKELVEVARLNVEVAGGQVERMERLVEVGNESRGRLLEVRAQLSEAELALTQAGNNRDISRLNLMHLLNMNASEDFGIQKPLFPDPSEEDIPPIDSVISYAMVYLPQIRSAGYGVEASERNLAMQRGGRSPRLYARGLLYSNYSDQAVNPEDVTGDYPVAEQVYNNQYRQVSVGVQIPIFNRWQVQTGIKKARIGLQDAEYQYDDVVLLMEQSVQKYHTEAVAALDNYRSAQESVANAEEVYRFAEERFRVGTGTALEMQDARRQYVESASAMITSRYVLIFYTKILDFYLGKEIEF